MKDKIIAKFTSLSEVKKCFMAAVIGSLITFAGLYMVSYVVIKEVKPNSWAEERVEEVIEEYTGIDLNLSGVEEALK